MLPAPDGSVYVAGEQALVALEPSGRHAGRRSDREPAPSSPTLDDGVRLDYAEPGVNFHGQHYALLVSDHVFDRAVERITSDGVPFWAGPGHTPGEINTNHGGRGVYVDDPSGHHFELTTQPYGADP